MSEIEWSPWIKHDGSSNCPQGCSEIRVQVKQNPDWAYLDNQSVGKFGPWGKITHYRIPMADYQRIYGGTADNHPAHYVSGGIECIDAIKAQMTPEQYAGYLRGNVAKYLWRYEHKGGAESLRKARWYLDSLIVAVEHE